MQAELALLRAWSKLQALFWPCPAPHHLAPSPCPHSLTFFCLHADLTCTCSLFLGEQISPLGLDNGLSLYCCRCRAYVRTDLDFQSGDLALSQGRISPGQLSWARPNLESHSHSWSSLGVRVEKGSLRSTLHGHWILCKDLTWISR